MQLSANRYEKKNPVETYLKIHHPKKLIYIQYPAAKKKEILAKCLLARGYVTHQTLFPYCYYDVVDLFLSS